jgi:RimJ/RimL family protein N-acetyltransferase
MPDIGSSIPVLQPQPEKLSARSRTVMERIGMRYAGEIRSRGVAEGLDGVQDDAPFAVCVLLRTDWQG